jgi:hypothetical protein
LQVAEHFGLQIAGILAVEAVGADGEVLANAKTFIKV